jgi:enoyl-CoA hydratase/carnithine racemase
LNIGKNLNATKAKKTGLVDHVVEPIGPGLTDEVTGTHRYLEDVAVRTALSLIDDGSFKMSKELPKKLKYSRKKPLMARVMASVLSNTFVREKVVINRAKDMVMKNTLGNYPAPLKILDVVHCGLGEGAQRGYELEAKVALFFFDKL